METKRDNKEKPKVNKEILEFKVFCIEAYKSHKKLKGKEVLELFKKYGVLEYISTCYNVLHTTSKEYIVNDIDIFIKARE